MTEQFNELFPFYLSIGMTYDQYWNGDCSLVLPYRKAQEIRNERSNQEMWVQGAYIYEALCKVAPAMNAFAENGTRPEPYPTLPYALTPKAVKARQQAEETEERAELVSGFTMFAASFNRKLAETESDNAND